MTNGTISEKCETLYNKLNSFVTSVINRDVTPKISNLNIEVWGSNTQTGDSRIYELEHRADGLGARINSLDTSIANKVDTVYATNVAVSSAMGFVNSPTIMFKRCGNTVICFLSNAQAKPTSTGWKTVCTVPSGYRNITGMEYMSIGQVNGTYFTQARYRDGNIEVYVSTAPSSNQYISFTGFWFTNDDYPSP